MEIKTNDLLKALSNDNMDLDEYFSSNPDAFVDLSVKQFWTGALRGRDISKCDIINKSDLSYCYFYDVINGRKVPNKDKIIRIVLAAGLSLDQCQEALRLSGKSALYPRIRRDSIIIYAINNRLSVYGANELLTRFKEETLK